MSEVERFRAYLTVVLLNLAGLGVIVWLLRSPTAGAVEVLLPPTAEMEAAVTPVPASTAGTKIAVHVSGGVARPGVVQLTPGSRAVDAISAAGGFTEDAAEAALNLAAPLVDGQQVHVPLEGEPAIPVPAVSAPPLVGGSVDQSAAGAPININAATASDLEALPGVGPAIAQRIVDDRAANGPFATVADLGRVSGIGPKTLERIGPLVTTR